MSVSVSGGLLDLFAPKFGLDGLGTSGEKVIVKVRLKAGSKHITLFGSYTIGTRHSQLAAKRLQEFHEVLVESVERYTVKDLVEGINASAPLGFQNCSMKLVWHSDRISMKVGEQELPATIEEVYTIGGNVWAVIASGRSGSG